MFLEAHFGEVELHMPDPSEEDGDAEQGEDGGEPSLLVNLDEADAQINLVTLVCQLFNKLHDDVGCADTRSGGN